MLEKLKLDANFLVTELKSLFTQRNGLRYFFFILLTYLLGYAALIRANVYYVDDLRRILRTNIGWDNFSRYSSNFLAKWVNMNSSSELATLDISPLSQILAIIFLALASLILVKALKTKFVYSSLLVSSAIGLSPFYLENMSYKMDSPYMAISVLAAIFPFLFTSNKRIFTVIGILSLLLMYTTYQPANSVFILVTLFLSLNHFIENKDIKQSAIFLAYCAIIFIVSTLIYKFFILQEINNYVSSQMLPSNKLVSGVIANIGHYFNIIYQNFSHTIIGKLVVVSVFALPIVIFFRTRNIIAFIISILVMLFAALLSFGLYTVLDKPLFDARAMNGVGVFCALVFLSLIKYGSNIVAKICQCISVVFVYNLFVIAYAYGNGLVAQHDFNEFRANALIYELNSKYRDMKQYNIYISNDKVIAPRTEIARKEFPVLNMLIQEANQGHWIWTALYNYWGKVNYNFVIGNCANNSAIINVIDTDMYSVTIYDNKCMIVNYKNY